MNRAEFRSTLFSGADQRQNFQSITSIFPTSTMSASPTPTPLPAGEPVDLPTIYVFEGKTGNVEALLDETDTMALLVLKDGKIRFERYAPWGGADRHWISMSVAKSVISTGIGIAVGEGLIGSIAQPITDYCPVLAGSAYDGVSIKDILQMSSGAGWNEDYSDPNSDIRRFGMILATGTAMNAFPQSLSRACPPGTFNHYNSCDTQVLGMLLTAATGQSITNYLQEKLWHPLGMESPGYWIVDDTGMEMAYGGLNATARDYAKIGELFRQGGLWRGKQIVSRDWVKASVTPDAPHLMPGQFGLSDWAMGYGYQWWVLEGDERDYSAIGVYNQFIYVNPTRNVTIVKLSANHTYGQTNDESSFRGNETFEVLRAIARAI
jgi:CubicO group peptidase (beta-lactamase class C family)